MLFNRKVKNIKINADEIVDVGVDHFSQTHTSSQAQIMHT